MGLGFRTEDAPDDFAPIPDGWYWADVERAELRPHANGDGASVRVGWEVTGPKHVGRWVWDSFTYEHSNPDAVSIGHRQLKKCCLAVGLMELDEPEELVGKSCQIRVTTRPATGDYPAKNTVKDYRDPSSSQTSTPEEKVAKQVAELDDDDCPF